GERPCRPVAFHRCTNNLPSRGGPRHEDRGRPGPPAPGVLFPEPRGPFMLWQLFGHRRPKKSTNRPARRRPLRPAVEALEDRWLPSTYDWIGGASGNFNVSTNWQPQGGATNAVPGTNDTAIIPSTAMVTVSDARTVSSVQNDLGGGAQLDIQGGGSLTL